MPDAGCGCFERLVECKVGGFRPREAKCLNGSSLAAAVLQRAVALTLAKINVCT